MTDQVIETNTVAEPEDDLRAAFAELRGRTEGAEEKPAAVETEEVKAERARDEAGRFAKQEAEKVAEVKTDQVEAPVAEAPKVTVKAPDGWTAEMKALFTTLDPKVQAEISRREADLTKKITSQDDDRSLGKRMREVSQPYAAIMNAEGASVDAAFKDYLNTAYILRTASPQAKLQLVQRLAQQYGIPLGQTLQQPAQIDPAIETLQQRLDRIERDRQAEVQTRQQQEQDALQSQIQDFAAQPGHEHFESVKALMGTLLQGGHAKDMQEAYDQACHANPDIRSTLTATQTAAAEEKRLADQKAKAEAAKRAAGSVTGGPGGVKPSAANGNSVGSPEDDLRAAFKAHSGRM